MYDVCASCTANCNCLTLASFSLIFRYNCDFNYFLFHPFIKQRTFAYWSLECGKLETNSEEEEEEGEKQTHSQLRDCGKCTQDFLLAFLFFHGDFFIIAGDTDVTVESIYQSKQQFNKEMYVRARSQKQCLSSCVMWHDSQKLIYESS